MNKIIEIQNNIFDEINNIKTPYLLVHCMNISLSTKKGIVVEIEKRYNIKELIKEKYNKNDVYIGNILITNNICSLITKNRVYDKPTYDSIKQCLINLYKYCKMNNIYNLIMPKIGCGLDKLNWDKVKNIINDIFKEKEFNIIVCYI